VHIHKPIQDWLKNPKGVEDIVVYDARTGYSSPFMGDEWYDGGQEVSKNNILDKYTISELDEKYIFIWIKIK
jgi:hypothetical protein